MSTQSNEHQNQRPVEPTASIADRNWRPEATYGDPLTGSTVFTTAKSDKDEAKVEALLAATAAKAVVA